MNAVYFRRGTFPRIHAIDCATILLFHIWSLAMDDGRLTHHGGLIRWLVFKVLYSAVPSESLRGQGQLQPKFGSQHIGPVERKTADSEVHLKTPEATEVQLCGGRGGIHGVRESAFALRTLSWMQSSAGTALALSISSAQ